MAPDSPNPRRPPVFTYYEPVDGMPNPAALLELWGRSWEDQGWHPVVLSESAARGHPFFTEYSERVNGYPTTNPPAYERACYLRHLAMANSLGKFETYLGRSANRIGLLVDYDCINRSFKPEDVRKCEFDEVMILEPTRVPCAVLATVQGFRELCQDIGEYDVPRGTKHTSDMEIIRTLDVPVTNLCVEHLCSGEQKQNDRGEGWKTAPIIHFSTYSFSKMGWTGPKDQLIRRALSLLPEVAKDQDNAELKTWNAELRT